VQSDATAAAAAMAAAVAGTSDEDSSPAKRKRRCPRNRNRRLQQRDNQFADDEADVSGDGLSADESDTDADGRRGSLSDFLDDDETQCLDIASMQSSQEQQEQPTNDNGARGGGRDSEASQDTDNTDNEEKAPPRNMMDIYQRSLFSQDAGNMGFASPPRHHPNRNRYRTDHPDAHGSSDSESSQQMSQSSYADTDASPQDGSLWGGGGGGDSQTAASSPEQQPGQGSSSEWPVYADQSPARGPGVPASPAQHRDSTDGYTAEAEGEDDDDDDDDGHNSEADFDCGVDSLWD